AAWAIEGEQLWRWQRCTRPVVRALEAFGEAQTRGAFVVSRGEWLREQDDAIAITLPKGGAYCIRQTAARLIADDEPVHHDEQLLRERDVDRRGGDLVEMPDDAVETHAHEALGAQILDHDLVRHLLRHLERESDVEARARRQGEHRVRYRLHRIGSHLATAQGAERTSDARPQEAQIVVDLRGSANGGPRRLRGVLLLDRDRRGQPVHRVDVRLLHALEKLSRIRRQRLDVPALALGVDRVERERRLARPGGSRDHREGATGDAEVEALQVVLPRTTNNDGVLHGRKVTLPPKRRRKGPRFRCGVRAGRSAAERWRRGWRYRSSAG